VLTGSLEAAEATPATSYTDSARSARISAASNLASALLGKTVYHFIATKLQNSGTETSGIASEIWGAVLS
jgi:hypothetical protein